MPVNRSPHAFQARPARWSGSHSKRMAEDLHPTPLRAAIALATRPEQLALITIQNQEGRTCTCNRCDPNAGLF